MPHSLSDYQSYGIVGLRVPQEKPSYRYNDPLSIQVVTDIRLRIANI